MKGRLHNIRLRYKNEMECLRKKIRTESEERRFQQTLGAIEALDKLSHGAEIIVKPKLTVK